MCEGREERGKREGRKKRTWENSEEENVYRRKTRDERREKRTGTTEPFRLHGHLEVRSLG